MTVADSGAPGPLWSVKPVFDWLLHRGRHLTDPEALLGAICARVREAGMPLERTNVFISTLHPQYFGFVLAWEDGVAQTYFSAHDDRESDIVVLSPMGPIVNGERVIRRHLQDPDCAMDFPILHELKAQGFTDYVIVELVFSSGARNGVSLATRHNGGFSDHDLQEIEQIVHLFAILMENHTNKGVAANLLDTYLGSISGARVLEGQIQRGDGDHIDAVIWFSDLRQSTPLAEQLGQDGFLALLNDYFEATAGAVLAHGGEVLRFIGDASPAEVCERVLSAAREVRERVRVVNEERESRGAARFDYGVGLHRGEVLYGNIGTPERLEFSVVGAAANETARIEAFTKKAGTDIVLSETVARHVDINGIRSLGKQQRRGVGCEIEVYALAV
jgi:adenylate cyclase